MPAPSTGLTIAPAKSATATKAKISFGLRNLFIDISPTNIRNTHYKHNKTPEKGSPPRKENQTEGYMMNPALHNPTVRECVESAVRPRVNNCSVTYSTGTV